MEEDIKKRRVTRKVSVSKVKNDGYAFESNQLARASHLDVTETKVILRRKTDEVSVWEGRIRLAILCQVNPWTDFTAPILINIRDLVTTRDGDTYQRIRNASERLVTYFKEIRDDENQSFTLINYFPYIRYKDGILTVNLNPKLKEHILAQQQNGNYTKLEYAHFRPLKTVAGQWLFEYISTYKNMAEGHKKISLDELHRVLHATDYQKAHFGEFSRRVLMPGLEDLRDNSGWEDFSWEYLKNGRRITGIDAHFRPVQTTDIIDVDLDVNLEEHKKWQRLSNICYEKHSKDGTICKPKNGKKCTYCTTRGRMYMKRILDESKQRRKENDVVGQGVISELDS